MDLEEAWTRGEMIAVQAILSAILVEALVSQGAETVRRIRIRAEAHLVAAGQQILSGTTTAEEGHAVSKTDAAAGRFLDRIFAAADSRRIE
ncbi:hypothetical protein [Methylorubrum extorquens]|uniref:Uncharacterized protein n=1 Tax=Methylorubrum extorquens (strain CM4 / NCIMB 13688) TaxID=440085 RepID=B7KYS7_METC4|nr:hypothetical protein [Methylorubrum extorquens]ACK81200.1 hypothetical protein Mchl_0261 [Methylorubrum extorquens CM4]